MSATAGPKIASSITSSLSFQIVATLKVGAQTVLMNQEEPPGPDSQSLEARLAMVRDDDSRDQFPGL
jgi:hypothetical protein